MPVNIQECEGISTHYERVNHPEYSFRIERSSNIPNTVNTTAVFNATKGSIVEEMKNDNVKNET